MAIAFGMSATPIYLGVTLARMLSYRHSADEDAVSWLTSYDS